MAHTQLQLEAIKEKRTHHYQRAWVNARTSAQCVPCELVSCEVVRSRAERHAPLPSWSRRALGCSVSPTSGYPAHPRPHKTPPATLLHTDLWAKAAAAAALLAAGETAD